MKEKILELRRKGLTINEIIKELNCAKSTVSYHINNIGLGGNRDKFLIGIDDDKISLIKKLRLELKTYSDILTLVNISEDKLKKVCRFLGLNGPNNLIVAKTLDDNDVINYYKTVKSLRLTSTFFGVSRETIRKKIPPEILLVKREKKISKSQAVVDWRKRKKIDLVKYKGGCCEKCGYNKSFEALQFHHINPSEKDFTIGGKSYSLERLKKEVDKCILVCANCHIEIHEELKNK